MFINSLREILSYAESRNLNFCIENNVAASFNQSSDGTNPFLCAEPDEINFVLDKVSSNNLHLLLDTAHLKVSSITLNFDLDSAVKKIIQKALVLHHSDNDGHVDSNSPIGKDYWFSKYFKSLPNPHYHVLEVKAIGINKIKSQLNLLKSFIE